MLEESSLLLFEGDDLTSVSSKLILSEFKGVLCGLQSGIISKVVIPNSGKGRDGLGCECLVGLSHAGVEIEDRLSGVSTEGIGKSGYNFADFSSQFNLVFDANIECFGRVALPLACLVSTAPVSRAVVGERVHCEVAELSDGSSIGDGLSQQGLSGIETNFLGAISNSGSSGSVSEINQTVICNGSNAGIALGSELSVQEGDLSCESVYESLKIRFTLSVEDSGSAAIGLDVGKVDCSFGKLDLKGSDQGSDCSNLIDVVYLNVSSFLADGVLNLKERILATLPDSLEGSQGVLVSTGNLVLLSKHVVVLSSDDVEFSISKSSLSGGPVRKSGRLDASSLRGGAEAVNEGGKNRDVDVELGLLISVSLSNCSSVGVGFVNVRLNDLESLLLCFQRSRRYGTESEHSCVSGVVVFVDLLHVGFSSRSSGKSGNSSVVKSQSGGCLAGKEANFVSSNSRAFCNGFFLNNCGSVLVIGIDLCEEFRELALVLAEELEGRSTCL